MYILPSERESLLKDEFHLPDKLFMVKVPMVSTYDEEEIDLMGFPLDENLEDLSTSHIATEMVRVMLPLHKIIDIKSNGYPIYLCDGNESEEIYRILDEYLTVHTKHLYNSLNVSPVDEIELKKIDEFLTEMFDYNRRRIVGGIIKNTSNGGFGINLNLMTIDNRQSSDASIYNKVMSKYDNEENGSFGVLSGYQNTGVINQQQIEPSKDNYKYSYIQPNQLEIDIDSVKKQQMIKPSLSAKNILEDELFLKESDYED